MHNETDINLHSLRMQDAQEKNLRGRKPSKRSVTTARRNLSIITFTAPPKQDFFWKISFNIMLLRSQTRVRKMVRRLEWAPSINRSPTCIRPVSPARRPAAPPPARHCKKNESKREKSAQKRRQPWPAKARRFARAGESAAPRQETIKRQEAIRKKAERGGNARPRALAGDARAKARCSELKDTREA